MATRFYLSSTGTVTQTPSFAAWSRTTEALRRSMSPVKDGSAITSTTIWANGNAVADESALARQFVSEPMSAGVAFSTSDTIKAQVRCAESAANDNINRAPIAVKVYSQDGMTLRATLLGLGHVGLNTTEWPTTLTNKTIANSDALTADYTTVLGDILVVELGGQVSSAAGTSVTGTMSFGSASATDLGENETDTAANNPWFEISRTVSFATVVITAAPTALIVGTFTPTLKFTTNVTPAAATFSETAFAPTLRLVITPAAASLTATGLTPKLSVSVTPATTTLTTARFAATVHERLTPATVTFSVTAFAPAVSQASFISPPATALTVSSQPVALSHDIVIPSLNLTTTLGRPSILPAKLIFLDPGGDATQAVGHFNQLIPGFGTDVTYDTTQQVVGVGSYRFDSNTNENPAVRVSGVLGNQRRVSCHWRYDSVPDRSLLATSFAVVPVGAYSGGGLADVTSLATDDGLYATAAPAKNAGQGSVYGSFGFGLIGVPGGGTLPPGAIIDAVKIIYERGYDVDTSIGISRVKWIVDGVEGPDHDNADMPLVDTVVEVDVTGDRHWERKDFLNDVFELVVEARRGDTDTAHTQSWDYVKVEVTYHPAFTILALATNADFQLMRIAAMPSGGAVVLQLVDVAGNAFSGITRLEVNTWTRISFGYSHNDADDLDIKLYVNGIEELSIVEADTGGTGIPALTRLHYGWLESPGVDHVCWFDQLYIDDGDDLTNPGNVLTTAKLPATINDDEFDTTGGTGAVGERPLSTTNYMEHADFSVARQNYTLQAASAGDVDLSGESLLGHMGWAWVRSFDPFQISLTVNGIDVDRTAQMSGTASLVRHAVTDSSYPSHARGIGLFIEEQEAETLLYECGMVQAYQGPPNSNILLERQLVNNETLATITDDLRADPPDSYEVCCQFDDFDGTVLIDIYSLDQDGGSVQYQGTLSSNGRTRINPGVEVYLDVTVTGVTMLTIWRRTNFD
jgi:hypothetical protein